MKLSGHKLFKEVFVQSFKATPFVFRNLNRYFAFYWIPCMILILFALHSFFEDLPFKTTFLKSMDGIFTIFIVPYWVYVFIKKESALPFWSFIAENVTPLVINYIKAFFVILASPLFGFAFLVKNGFHILQSRFSKGSFWYALLLLFIIFPPLLFGIDTDSMEVKIYLAFIFLAVLVVFMKRVLELTLVLDTSFFEENKRLALKESQRLSRPILWSLFLYLFVLIPIVVFVTSFLLKAVLSRTISQPFVTESAVYILNFYFYSFIYIVTTQLYFVLKKYQE